MEQKIMLNMPLKFYGETYRSILDTANLLLMVDNMEAQGVSSAAVVLLDEVGEQLVRAAGELDHTSNSLMAMKSFLPGARDYLSIRHTGKMVDVKLPHTAMPKFCMFCSMQLGTGYLTIISELGYDTNIVMSRCSCGAEYNRMEDTEVDETADDQS